MRDTANRGSSDKELQRPKARVKSGCRTCRARRIKCDEVRPACSRCTSTGRFCEGYGIWGVNASRGPERRTLSRGSEISLPRPPPPISILVGSTEEKDYFDWFKARTLHRLCGSFVSRFWNILVIQGSFQEPAIMHAVLALSAIHRRGVDTKDEETAASVIEIRNQGQFALTHYLQAIKYLQTHFKSRDKPSLQVALMACILFVTFEFFRGHFETGQSHLKSGLRIISSSSGAYGDVAQRGSSQALVDDWILEAFARLQFQVELFKFSYQGPALTLSKCGSAQLEIAFQSINECWHELQRVINNILRLSDQCDRLYGSFKISETLPALLEQQKCLQRDLDKWLYAFETLKATFSQGRMGYEEKKGYGILPVYHNLATIMAGVCLSLGNESAFDAYTTQFVVMVNQMAQLWMVSQHSSSRRPGSPDRRLGTFLNMAHSYADIGWIPALFYTATKCRVHRVRLQAIRLLECSSHREGIWDSQIAACIARKAMQMEERDFYDSVDTHDSFPLSSCPTPQDLSLPLVPSSSRIRKLDAVLSGEPMEKIILFGGKEENSVGRAYVLSEYSVDTHCWTDKPI
ncbi:unnamed protein product [Clonostachys rosea]|uniref:Zn(2)-C6 fungal-type domain-containing protein n=1 Tax=Bionectria ochroleuca TaxID=29856 RepID=A0ABY6U538_BIOOC|nr:unnamed protein product [Clonostachys rosea]